MCGAAATQPCFLLTSSFSSSSPPQITKQQLQQTKDRFQAFLNGDTQIVADEAFINAVQSYYEVSTNLVSVKNSSPPKWSQSAGG